MQRNYIIGTLLVALANFIVGFNIVCNKYLVSSIPVSVLLELRYFFGVLVLLIFIIFSKNKFRFYLTDQKFSWRDRFIYLFMALSGGAIFNAIYMVGIHHTTAIATGIISSTVPVLVTLFSFIFLHQKIRRNHIISAFAVMMGICIINLGYSHPNDISITSMQLGNFIVFLAMIPEALFTISAKLLIPPVSPLVSALLINAINLLFCTPFFLIKLQTFSLYTLTGFSIFLIFLKGFFSSALFYILYNMGIPKITATNAGLLVGMVPISTAILSYIFLGESFGLFSFIGMLFVLASIYIGVRSTSKGL